MATTDSSPYARSIVALVDDRWERNASLVVLRYTDADDNWIDVTGAEAAAHVAAVAKGLIAKGMKAGDAVGIMARTRYEWTVLDMAIWAAGGVPVPIYDTSSGSQVDWITSDANIGLLFVENAAHAELARKVASDSESPLREVMVIDDGALEALAALGTKVSEKDLQARKDQLDQDTLATIIYTSGTTGRPKGVELNHFHFVRHYVGITESLSEVLLQPGASTVLFLTLAHSLARVVEVVLLGCGAVIGYCPDPTKLVPYIGSFQPTLILAVPRVFEKVYNSAEQKAAAGGKVKIFRWAAKTAIEYSEALDTPGGPGATLKYRHKVADKLVLHKIKAVLGKNATWAVSGSAPLGSRLGHFYRGLGLHVLEGYGLTETTAASHVNRPGNVKIGTVGQALPGVEVKIADDGEVLMRGDVVFVGYHRNDKATKESMTSDGWLATGDVGIEDANGFLTITGRKKEIIVTAGGKNVAPAVLEDRLRAYPLVSQCVVVGDARPYIAALITLDPEALPAWLKNKGLEDMTVAEAMVNPTVREHVDKAVQRANKAVSRAESIRKWEFLPEDFTVANGYLTPSMKLKRASVLQDFSSEVDALYTGSENAG